MSPDIDKPNVSIIENLGQIISIGVFVYVGINLAMNYIGGIFVIFANIIYYTFVFIGCIFAISFILRLLDELFTIAYERFGKKIMNIAISLCVLSILISVQLSVMYTNITYQTFIDMYYKIFWVIIDVIKL